MTDFILRPDNSGLILASLRRALPQFFSSQEYEELKDSGRELAETPGLVCAAFTRYLCRILEGNLAPTASATSCFALIEEWASHSDPIVRNYVVTEIFENVRLPTLGERSFKDRLEDKSKKLYEEWMENPPEDRLAR